MTRVEEGQSRRNRPGLSGPVRDFLARHGMADVAVEPLEGDASSRRYYRLAGKGLLLMEDSSDPEGFDAYLRLSPHLVSLGLSAPRVEAADPGSGLALIEDFGHATYGHCLSQGHDETGLYALATDVLIDLHRHPAATGVDRPPYDLETHLAELDIFSAWFAPEVAADGFDRDRFSRDFRELWSGELAGVAQSRETLVLRDFHVDNLMHLPDRSAAARCGLLDFQHAVIGPREYDLASLLQDARRDLKPGLEAEMLARYISGASAGPGEAEQIRHRYHLLSAQRHARILGVFVRLFRRDGKPHYLRFMPRVTQQLRAALDAAGLGEIRDFLDASLPGWQTCGAGMAAILESK